MPIQTVRIEGLCPKIVFSVRSLRPFPGSKETGSAAWLAPIGLPRSSTINTLLDDAQGML
jgi:hypothetical protein